MFIPLASTTSASSSPSPSTPPLDDGITTVKHYIYIHTNLNPRTHDTTKKYYFNWHDNIKCQSHCIYNSTCPYRCCTEMCRYCSRGNSNSQRSKIDLYARSSKKNTKGSIQGIYKSPFSGIPLAQSVLDGIPSTNRGLYPSFVTHPNYHNGQIHYPPNPISQPPPTSATTTARVTSNQTTST